MWRKKKLIKHFAGSTNELSPRTQWGKLIVYLREHNNIALHVACGDISDVFIENNVFIIRTDQEYIYDMLNTQDNQKQLQEAFLFIGINKYKILKSETLENTEQIVHKLKEYFGDNVIIKGD